VSENYIDFYKAWCNNKSSLFYICNLAFPRSLNYNPEDGKSEISETLETM